MFSQYHADPQGVLSKIRVEAMSKSVFEKPEGEEGEQEEDMTVEQDSGE